MKNIIILMLLFLSVKCYAAENTYKVLRVIDGDTVYLDFNKDGYIQKDERVRLNGIDTFEVTSSYGLYWQMKVYKFNKNEALGLGYLAKEFAKGKLGGKYVKAVYSAQTKRCSRGRHLMSIYYKDEKGNYKNYEEDILKSGLAVVYSKSNLAPELRKYENLKKLRENAKLTKGLKLAFLDKKNKVYYSTDCKYGQGWWYFELVDVKKYGNSFKPVACPIKP